MRVYNIQFETNRAMNANHNSTPEQLWNIIGYAIQVVMTGTPTGTFKLQGSCDPATQGPGGANENNPSNWSDIANTSQAVSGAGTYMWNINEIYYNWVRLVYTDGSSGMSTATFNATFNGKGV